MVRVGVLTTIKHCRELYKRSKKMNTKISELKQVATNLLSGMLANPHIYSVVSDELGRGQQEQDLIIAAIEMAEILLSKVENKIEAD